ncbi:MAG: hypothetical protein BRC33_01595 [Cyanobacteria bacterium SW_9_44_58]|nr:MAG: hypothetical protein BRC33_01595 [Cyanobacteria bacterium SW_9_44_58]
MPKTYRYRDELQNAVFTDGSFSPPGGDFWVAYYETDPTLDPESKAPSPIQWQEGSYHPIDAWSVHEGCAVNQVGFLLTNNLGRKVTVRFFVLWQSDSPQTSYFADQVGINGYTVEKGGQFPVDLGDLAITEF